MSAMARFLERFASEPGRLGSKVGRTAKAKIAPVFGSLTIATPPFALVFVIDTRKAQHVREQCAIGIEMPRLRNQADSGQRERPQARRFVGSQTSLKPDKVTSVLELGFHLTRVGK